ncbi:MAG: TIR domain-containing protein [Ignavibacteriae bacterium]|nr:TIR domain-containing protein [Ignavibacteriota bacterium]
MARRVFFSFHYKNDVWRANQVRNSWITKEDREIAGFIDAAEFEKVEKEGEESVKRWINKQLDGTSVTVVLLGSDTSNRPYVQYELQQSFQKGNGLLGIYIHQLRDRNEQTSVKGSNHFGAIGYDEKGNPIYFSTNYPCYDWVDNNGYDNIGKWIELAAQKAGR